MSKKIDPAAFYLEWLNDYVTVQRIAADYGISDHRAKCLIERGRQIRAAALARDSEKVNNS
jgi:hypothetical protein